MHDVVQTVLYSNPTDLNSRATLAYVPARRLSVPCCYVTAATARLSDGRTTRREQPRIPD